MVRELLERGERVVSLDLGGDPYRIAMVTPAGQPATLEQVAGDITDLDTVQRTLEQHAITNVICCRCPSAGPIRRWARGSTLSER